LQQKSESIFAHIVRQDWAIYVIYIPFDSKADSSFHLSVSSRVKLMGCGKARDCLKSPNCFGQWIQHLHSMWYLYLPR
jgi:hypothetical protein